MFPRRCAVVLAEVGHVPTPIRLLYRRFQATLKYACPPQAREWSDNAVESVLCLKRCECAASFSALWPVRVALDARTEATKAAISAARGICRNIFPRGMTMFAHEKCTGAPAGSCCRQPNLPVQLYGQALTLLGSLCERCESPSRGSEPFLLGPAFHGRRQIASKCMHASR